MTDLSPIIENCKALTYGCKFPENNGKIVTVIRFAGNSRRIPKYTRGDLWEISDTVTWCVKSSGGIFTVDNLIPDRHLMRIDGYVEESKMTESQEIEYVE
jgi:hypothetical protein